MIIIHIAKSKLPIGHPDIYFFHILIKNLSALLIQVLTSLHEGLIVVDMNQKIVNGMGMVGRRFETLDNFHC